MAPEASADSPNMAEIPTEQMAQVVETIGGPLVYKKIPVPRPGPDQVLVRVLYSGVCHTDLHAMLGDWPVAPTTPLIGGHEGAGIVVALGSLVPPSSLSIGDSVGIQWLHSSCLACEYCLAGDEPLCARGPDLSGYTVPGSFQQYCVASATHVARLPAGCRDLAAVAPVLCAGVTVYKALKESAARPGQCVVIAGAGGGLGALACQYARAMGLRVIGVDTGAEKEALIRGYGADFVDFAAAGEEGLVADIKALTPGGLGAHAALLVAAKEEPFQQATRYVRARGVVVCIGLPPADAHFRAPVFDTVMRMIQIRGSYVGNRLDTSEALEFYSRGLIEVPFKTVGLSELQSVYDLMKAGKVTGRYVLDTSR